MDIEPRTPVIVGVGQVTDRPDDGEEPSDPAARREPVALMAQAVLAAFGDCTGARGAVGPAGRRLLDRLGSLRVVNPVSWPYVNPGRLVAEAVGAQPDEVVLAAIGGDNPQRLVNATALAIGRGELDVAVIAGAESGYSVEAAHRHPDRPSLPWAVQPPDTPKPVAFGTEQRMATESEEARGLDHPTTVYPLFENALRAAAHRGLDEHRERIGGLWSRCSEVAAANPYAWSRQAYTGAQLITPTDDNRMLAYPYTRLLTIELQVDMAAALVLCSAEAADAAGVPRERWVFPLSGASADDHWFLSHRADFHSSPAIRLAGATTLALAGMAIDEVAHVDLYSPYPAVVEITAAELGLSLTDPGRPLTLTGGQTFVGTPGSNACTHAIATLVDCLRHDAGSSGLVTCLAGHMTRHAVGLYGTRPAATAAAGATPGTELPMRTVTEVAGGFRWGNPQAAVGALPQCFSDADAVGEVTVETYSVLYERGGGPTRAVVACRTPHHRRAWGRVVDLDQLAVLVTEEGCGRLGTLRPDGIVDLS